MTLNSLKPEPDYTEEELQALIGKRLLVGITHYNSENTVVSLEQFHGVISRIGLNEGIVIKLNGLSEERTIPPDFSCLEMARPGQYRLTNSGEVVEDPDYIATWNVYPKGYKG